MKTKTVIDVSDWDALVEKTYERPYNLQQQDGCQDRGAVEINVPNKTNDCYNCESVPEEVNHEKMGVNLKAWLTRDPKKEIVNQKYDWELRMWWERNFYPDIQMVANDLHAKGLLASGKHTILIDW